MITRKLTGNEIHSIIEVVEKGWHYVVINDRGYTIFPRDITVSQLLEFQKTVNLNIEAYMKKISGGN